VSSKDSIRNRFRSKGFQKQSWPEGRYRIQRISKRSARQGFIRAKPRAKHPRFMREISGRMTKTNIAWRRVAPGNMSGLSLNKPRETD